MKTWSGEEEHIRPERGYRKGQWKSKKGTMNLDVVVVQCPVAISG